MEFRRINALPPYVFATIDTLKTDARRAGEDVIDLGFGNPDIPSPPVAVDKLGEAVRNPRNHRYSASRGIPKLRQAVADLYQRRFGVTLDPETEAITTIGAKEGFSHLMWVLLGPGDAALVPSPSYPIHIWGPLFAGAAAREIPMSTDGNFIERVRETYQYSWPKPRVIVLSFPHNPTTACVDLQFFQDVVDFACEHDVVVVHDNAYAELGFDGYRPPSILQAEGAKECAVELYSMTKAFSMAAARLGYCLTSPAVVDDIPKVRLPYHLSSLTQTAGEVALRHVPEARDLLGRIREQRDRILEALALLDGVESFPSDANFALFRTAAADAGALWQAMLDRGVLVRDVSAYPGLDRCLRVTAGTPEETGAFLTALPEALKEVG
jgi:alanine-synthesizing transaminase